LSELRGEIIVLDFWGAWCRGCVLEHSMMVELGLAYSDSDVHFFGVTEDSDAELTRFAERWGAFSYPMLLDDGTIAEDFDIVGWPTKVIIARDGSVVWWQPGGPQPVEIIRAAIDSVLAGAIPVPGSRSGFPIEPER
jgi:peroxiredoxin